ncbi:hypothetical protein Leryth_006037 [Lithospermum erythrorhizon]|nr:hypothetical protein Leryth_006037 [Lithospermum erythrorhizon]
MDFIKKICADSPYVWDKNGVSKCFADVTVLGFSVNMFTLILVVLLAFTRTNANSRRSISSLKYVPAKILLQLLPAIGACIGFIDMVLLLTKLSNGFPTLYHEWLFKASQFLLWVSILFFLRILDYSQCILCVWWIVKPIFLIPYLQIVFSSSQVVECFTESISILLYVIFGFLITTVSVKWAYTESSSTEESLLPCKVYHEEQQLESEFIHKFWHLLTFKSIDTVMERGAKKQLDFEDLLQLPDDMDPMPCHNILQNCWESQQRHNISHPSLFKAICYAYGWPYFRLGLLKVLNDCLGFLGPLILNKLIRFLQEGSTSFDGYILALSLGITSIVKSFLDTQYTFRLSTLKLKLRSGIMTVIYEKCLCVKLAERSKFSEGEIQTFMSVDADRTVNLCNSFHDMWSLPLQIGIALYLLYIQVKFAFVAGVAITILLIPVNKWIATLIANATKKMMEHKDERIRRAAELLTHIRTLKMYSWELLFSGWLMKTRSLEVMYLSTRKYLDAWCVFFWATTPTLFSLCTFGLYTLMGHQLDAATVFTCLALFNNLISPLNSFPWVINGLIDAIISTRRLSNYLSCPGHETKPERGVCKKSNFEDKAIIIQNASCSWSNSDHENFSLILDSVNLLVPRGSLVAVIGEVGSGKSSLLSLILGEMRLLSGSAHSCGSTAYVPQVPWIQSGTIRDNIIFGRDFEPSRYSAVLKACALEHDLSLMTGGDMACIGEKGINLSGGQKARVALARAIYSRSDDIYLLDDVLSAVDAHVARSILHDAILGPLINQQTRILCTHNIQAISASDIVIVMDKGHVKWVGCPIGLSVSTYSTFLSVDDDNFSSGTRDQRIRSKMSNEAQEKVVEGDSITVSDEIENIEEELRKEGRVESTVYKNYATFSGRGIAILICLSALFMQASRNGNDLWLSYWVDIWEQSKRALNYILSGCTWLLLFGEFLTNIG